MENFFAHGESIEELNKTNLVLISKIDNLEKVGNICPISLCNYSNKIISKVITNRMKHLMSSLISENQRAFVEGRLI